MPCIYAFSGRLPKAIGGTSTVKVLGTELEKGMLVTIVSDNSKSKRKVWVGTVTKKDAKGYCSVDIVALTKSTPDEITINDMRVTVGLPGDKLRSIEDTEQLQKPLPVPPPPPVPPPGGLMYVPIAWIKKR